MAVPGTWFQGMRRAVSQAFQACSVSKVTVSNNLQVPWILRAFRARSLPWPSPWGWREDPACYWDAAFVTWLFLVCLHTSLDFCCYHRAPGKGSC